MRVRHYGVLSYSCRGKKLSLIQTQTQGNPPHKEDFLPTTCTHHWACPKCKQGELLLMELNTPLTHQNNTAEVYRLSG